MITVQLEEVYNAAAQSAVSDNSTAQLKCAGEACDITAHMVWIKANKYSTRLYTQFTDV